MYRFFLDILFVILNLFRIGNAMYRRKMCLPRNEAIRKGEERQLGLVADLIRRRPAADGGIGIYR